MTLGKVLNPPVLSFLICQKEIPVVTGIKRCSGSTWHVQLSLLLLLPTVVRPAGWGPVWEALGATLRSWVLFFEHRELQKWAGV